MNAPTAPAPATPPTVILKPREADRIVAGHPWVYAGAIMVLFLFVIMSKENSLFGTGFLTQTAEDATQHIDLIDLGVFFFPVQMLFPWLALFGHHGNGFCRTSHRAKPTSRAALGTLFVPL